MSDLQSRKESERAAPYQAYLDYREMGISRSLRKLHESYTAPTSPTDCPTTRLGTLEKWSAKFDWQKRIEDWQEHLRDEQEKADAQARLKERKKRAKILKKMRKAVDEGIDNIELESELDVKKFTALTRAFKVYMDTSMKQYNDLPTEKTDLTSGGKAVHVNFITEPVTQDKVSNRLKELGLAHLVDEHTN